MVDDLQVGPLEGPMMSPYKSNRKI